MGIRGARVGGESGGRSVCGWWSLVTNVEYLGPWLRYVCFCESKRYFG
jgi:hypothetical protein